MEIKHVRTGPFKIVKIVESDPRYLIVQFDDINPSTNKPSQRKMSRGGNWPSYLADLVQEKVQDLLGELVYVITSQTTKNWSTFDWFCDVETQNDYGIKGGFGNALAADGSSHLKDNLVIDGLSIIDCSLGKACFEDENEYHVFYQTLQKRFNSAISNKTQRHVDDDITRVRLPDKKRDKGSQGGFRATVWQALTKEEHNFDYYIILRVDRKTLEKKFPEKEEMSEIVASIKDNYSDISLAELVINALSKDSDEVNKPTTRPATKRHDNVYLNCPFNQKDECKSLGGKWDPNVKKWFVPTDLPLEPFKKWLPKTQISSTSSDGFFRHSDIPFNGLTDDEKDAW